MTGDQLMEEACRLAMQSVEEGWGGPFGAVIVRGGEIVARGQNRVLLTGDPTAHAELEAIRSAVAVLQPGATLELVEVREDSVPARAKMLAGHEMYVSGTPCPMCMSAIYWARIDALYFAADVEAAREIGFDDAFLYEELAKPHHERRLAIRQFRADLGAEPHRAWAEKPDKQPY